MDLTEPLRTGVPDEEAGAASGDPRVPAVAVLRWRSRATASVGALLGLVAFVLAVEGLPLGASPVPAWVTFHTPHDSNANGVQHVDPMVMLVNDGAECTLGCKSTWWCESGCDTPACRICSLWLDLWTSEINKTCTNNKIPEDACEHITDALLDKRWKVYLSIWIMILIVWLAWLAGRTCQRRFPPYWKNRGCMRNIWACFDEPDYHELVNIYDKDLTNAAEQRKQEELRQSVQDLFDATTESKNMGVGYDGSFQKHKSFNVVKVERIENARNWKKYSSQRATTPKVKRVMDRISNSDQLKKAGKAQRIIDAQQKAMRKTDNSSRFIDALQLDHSRNEVLLFHGSPGQGARDRRTAYEQMQFPGAFSPLEAICSCGFDQRLGSSVGMLGSGVYFADKVSKADCYAGKYGGEAETTVGEEACILISRVVLGCPYLAENTLNGMRRPPSTHGEFDVHLLFDNVPLNFGDTATTIKAFWQERQDQGWSVAASNNERFYSVISDRTIDGGYKRFHEYAIYNGIEAYPEFKVTYTRVAEALPQSL